MIDKLLAKGRWPFWMLAAGVAVLTAVSCATVTRTVVVPPDIPGANYIGSAECEVCHDEIYRDFQTADHARLISKGPNSVNVGCEACHGPGSLHSDAGGEVKIGYNAPGKPRVSPVSRRETILNPRKSNDYCFTCHLDKRGQFGLPSHHPVPEGRLSCVDCHDPHKGHANRGGGTALLSQNAACVKCHDAQRGPHVFEHEAMREGCTTCHDPHGSVNPKMLVARNQALCLKCHFQQVTPGRILIGGFDHRFSLQQGTCWTAGCHEAVHGSRVNPSLRF